MAASWVLKVPRSDDDQGHVLIQVSRKDGRPDLDLTLLGTESSLVYSTKSFVRGAADQLAVRQKKARGLRSSKYLGSDDEWETMLRHVFLLKQQPGISPALRKGLETVAVVAEKDGRHVLTITIRRRIDEITQKLGSIDLHETEEEIQLFDWATSAVDEQRSLQDEVDTLQSQSEAGRATITALQTQLADLVKAKKEHDEQLLSKFTVLLNEKKLKIRNQQRILSAATVDENKLAQLRQTLGARARPTTGHKRRAATDAEAHDQEKDGRGDFETMDVDHMPNALGDARSSRETTPDTETDSEGQRSADQPFNSTLTTGSRWSKASKSECQTPPPPRQLPFVTKSSTKGDETTTSNPFDNIPGSDEETASEDDEL